MGALLVVTILLALLLQSCHAFSGHGAIWVRSGVSRRPHTPVRTGRSPRKYPESLVGRQGLEPWTLGLKARRPAWKSAETAGAYARAPENVGRDGARWREVTPQ